jgi:hypothetical protein
LNKALEKQEQANDIVQATLVENKLQALEEEKGIESLATANFRMRIPTSGLP